jgi:nucleolysin TIA-1/TIAR
MAENNSSGAAPGQTGYETGAQQHMPPPSVPSLTIPPNNNPVPTPVDLDGILSPTSAGGQVRRSAPEPNKRALYVGGLDPRVTEEVLKQIFETTGHVQNVKIIPDKNVSCPGGSIHIIRVSCPRSSVADSRPPVPI